MARRFGTANRQVEDLRERAKELKIDPWDLLLYFAAGDYKALGYDSAYISKPGPSGQPYEVLLISPELRQKSAADAAQYIHAKRKALELPPDPDTGKQSSLIINLSGKPVEVKKEETDASSSEDSV